MQSIERSVSLISSLMELQAKGRPLTRGDVGAMAETVALAGVDASISREVGHTIAAIGASGRASSDLFVAEGGLELLNSLARAHASPVRLEAASAFVAFASHGDRDVHHALHKHGGLAALVHLARTAGRNHHPELAAKVAHAFALLAERHCGKTWLVQCGALPFLFAFTRDGDADARYHAAKALLYMR